MRSRSRCTGSPRSWGGGGWTHRALPTHGPYGEVAPPLSPQGGGEGFWGVSAVCPRTTAPPQPIKSLSQHPSRPSAICPQHPSQSREEGGGFWAAQKVGASLGPRYNGTSS